jgi:nitrate/nitrite transporter NarK
LTRLRHANGAKISLGALASIGVFAYAIGKFLGGGLADLLGGRRAFAHRQVVSVRQPYYAGPTVASSNSICAILM